MKYNAGAMSFEERAKKFENSDAPEDKSEKKLSLSEIDELLKKSKKVSDNLDKFSKDDLFKKVDFYDKVEFKDKLNDEYDSVAYEKADFWKKFENFTRFGFHKERYGLLKSKERGLLDKNKINKDVSGQDIDDSKFSELEKFAIEEKLVGNIGMRRKDLDRIMVSKRYEIVDGEIVKIVESRRTDNGAKEAAGEMREEEISRLETVNGAELVGLKEAMERSAKSKESFLKLGESMSDEEREKITAKLDAEESQTKEKIKEKEERLAEETKIFREPLEGRLQEILKIQDSLTEAFDFIKTGESNLNKQIKDCESFIKESQKLDLLGGVGGDAVKIFEDKKAVLDAQIKEFAERKKLVSSKLETLKNNKKEIEATLNRLNNIGKTKQEIAEEGKDKKKDETETKSTKNKKSGTESVDTKKDKDNEHDDDDNPNEYKFKKFKQFFERFKEKFPVQGEQITKLFDPTLSLEKFKEIVDQINTREQPPKEGIYDAFDYEIGNRGRSLTVKYFENGRVTVSVHFEDIQADKSDNREENKKTWDETRDEVWGLKNTMGKKESQKIGKTFDELFPTYDYPGRKKEKKQDERTTEEERKEQNEAKVEEEIEVEENEEVAEKIFTKEEIAEITLKELKVLGIMGIKDRTMREQITGNVIMAVEAMIAKSKESVEENDIKKEVKDWYKKFTKNNSKKGKQPKK